MQLTKNFNLSEFACNDGNPVPRNLIPFVQELADNLQALRDMMGKPIKVNSGYRTPYWNSKVGGSSRSYHMRGMAADIRIDGVSPSEVYRVLLFLIKEGVIKPGGIKCYDSFVHYDTRGELVKF